MSYSDSQILQKLGKNIIIEPFNRSQLGPNSHDVTLGKYYYRYNSKNPPKYLSTLNPEQILQYWNVNSKSSNFGAHKAKLIKTQQQVDKYGVKVGQRIIVLQPGELILAHTQEIIGTIKNCNSMIQSKSSNMRCTITICQDSNFANIGYINRFTLEIQNHGQVPVVLIVGQRIGQVIFNKTGDVLNSYEGNYNIGNLQEVKKNWTPLCMIPSIAVTHLLGQNYNTWIKKRKNGEEQNDNNKRVKLS